MKRRQLASPVAAGLLMTAACLPVGLIYATTATGAAVIAAGGGISGFLGQRWAVNRRK